MSCLAGSELLDDLDVDAVDGALVRLEPLVSFVKDRKTYTAGNGTTLPGTLIGIESAPPLDAVRLVTHQNAGVVWDFYQQVLGRDSLDGQGLTIKSTVHYGVNKKQAAYVHGNQKQMWYGDGAFLLYHPFGQGLDVVAHEMSHGVFRHEAQINSNKESLAVYESYSDILAAATEAWVDGGVNADTWKVGEDIVIKPPNKTGVIRIMNDPAVDEVSVDHYDDFSASLSEHANAGIMNLAFYLVSQGGSHPRRRSATVTGVGIVKARLVFYRGLRDYLSGTLDFGEVRQGVLSAASQLYGSSSTTYHAVDDAFCVVGVGPGC